MIGAPRCSNVEPGQPSSARTRRLSSRADREVFLDDTDRASLLEVIAQAAQLHVDNTLKTLHEIYDAEKRLQVSIRRLERNDLVAPQKGK